MKKLGGAVMRGRFKLAVAFVLGAVGIVAAVAAHEAWAASQVTFLVPAGTPIEPGLGYDSFVFTGQVIGHSGVGNCNAGGPFPVQNGVVTPGPNSTGGAIRLTGVIVLGIMGVEPGIRLHPLQYIISCTGEGGLAYDRWSGDIIQ